MSAFRARAVFCCPRCGAGVEKALKVSAEELARRCRTGGGKMPRCLACGHAGRGLADFLQVDATTLEVDASPARPRRT